MRRHAGEKQNIIRKKKAITHASLNAKKKIKCAICGPCTEHARINVASKSSSCLTYVLRILIDQEFEFIDFLSAPTKTSHFHVFKL